MKDLKKIQEFFSKPLNEAKKKLPNFKIIPSWAKYVAQSSDGEWTWYEDTPTMIKFKDGGGAWKQDGNQTYTGVKTNGKDWDKIPTYYNVKNGKITESVNEAKVNYDFSERELIRVLRQLKRNASTEIDMIKAFTKALGRDITKDELFSESIDEAIGSKVEVVLSNQILDFLQQRNLITGVNAQKVHKDLTAFIKNIKINLNADLDEAIVLESVYTDPNTGKNYDLQYVSSKNRWELDIMKKDSSIYDKITTIKRDHIDDIIDWLDGYNIDSSWVIPKVNESVNLKQSKLSSSEYQKAKKLKDFNKDDYEWNSVEGLYVKEKKSKFKKHGEMSGFDMRGLKESSVVEKVIAQLKEEKPGLWANIRAKKARGGKPAHGNSDAHKTAVKAGKKINSLKEEEGVPHYTKDGKEWKGKLHKMPDGSLMSGNPHDKNGSGPNGKSEKLFHKEDLNEIEGKSLK